MDQSYGVNEPDATMLAVSLDEVTRRLRDRDTHIVNFAKEPDAGKVADVYRDVFFSEDVYYNEAPDLRYFGMTAADCGEAFVSKNIQWAPDGDEAFDDGSYVLQFDIGNQVRLIAFRCNDDGHHDPTTLRDQWLASDDFYAVLERWRLAFLDDWASLPKVIALSSDIVADLSS
jgi:hypothetical protein